MPKGVMILYYTASWCVPCKQFRPLASKEAFDRGLEITFIDVDENVEAAAADGVMSVPTVIVIDETAEVGRVVGASVTQLKKVLDKVV